MPEHALAIGCWRVARANKGGQFRKLVPFETVGRVPDTGQGSPEVTVDVISQRLHGGDVENPAAPLGRRCRLVQKPIEYPEKSCQRLATPGRGMNQGVRAGDDVPPALFLGQSRGRERGPKPGGGGRVEVVEGIHVLTLFGVRDRISQAVGAFSRVGRVSRLKTRARSLARAPG